MPSVLDVAAYILKNQGEMTAMKLQKLVYYAQAWSLVWDDAPLFPERIEAWANGPVTPTLFDRHRGRFQVRFGEPELGNPDALTAEQRETVDVVLRDYGGKPAQWLSDLSHAEDPWKRVWGGRKLGDVCHDEITLDSMLSYYSALLNVA